MAKTARKGASLGQKSSMSQKSNPKFYPAARAGGKTLNAYSFQHARNRRLSIAESTSSESSDGLSGRGHQKGDKSGSDSDSSLTAMSEEQEEAASRKGSVIFDTGIQRKKNSNSERGSKHTRPYKSSKSSRKAVSGKAIYYDATSSSENDFGIDSDNDSENDDDGQSQGHADPFFPLEGFEDINDDDDKVGLEAIYSMVGGNTSYAVSNSEDSNEDDSQDDEVGSSSSDDSEVDFVRLQVERRMNKVPVGQSPEKKTRKQESNSEKPKTKRRKSSVFRRRSELPIPEDINFKFEFHGPQTESAIDDEVVFKANSKKEEEEDLGEEVPIGQDQKSFDFHFDQPLMDVPKIHEDELNSEDEYAFDDNDLLATLQADNDLEEFITEPKVSIPKVRHGSLSSMNEDENEDSFLKEEEKYLVNEFETNGFDQEDAEQLETTRTMNSFHEMDGFGSQPSLPLQYASSSDGNPRNSGDEDEAGEYDFDEDDGDDYVDFMDFESPFFDDVNSETDRIKEITSQKPKPVVSKHKKTHFPKKKRGPLDSEDDDDSYLWNYFFSSDAESQSEVELDQYDTNEQLILEEVFRQNLEDRKKQMERESSMEPVNSDQDQAYDSGESTDVDLSLPSSSAAGGLGSKSAKEVLSSKTADYRPPVLGTWAAIDSKPFGIIDGLSTRMLNNNASAKNPRTKNWRGIALKNNTEDVAIELEELLNVSELDNDDENDVRIWRDFNNNKKHVPLGAFRNKAHITHPMIVAEPMTPYNVSKNANFNRKRRHSNFQVKAKLASKSLQSPESSGSASLSKDLNLPSKSRMRRASMADAVSEGYRPTKSGLFNETVLADVEEVLGDDRDFMALVTGL